MTTPLGYYKGADIASASSITVGPDGTYQDITGTVAVNSITSRRGGSIVTLRIISGGLTFIHLAGTLNMPGKVDFTSKAGDLFQFIAEGNGEWTGIRLSVEEGLLLIGRLLTLTMETGANWFTATEAHPILAGGVFTGAGTGTMETGANWFAGTAAETHWACQCHCCC